MINGAHVILYSTDAEADRAFLRDVMDMRHVDVGDGWLIFALPPSELAVHPSDRNDVHELYLMCDDIGAFVASMKKRGVECGAVMNRGWGLLTDIRLPSGGRLGVYEPRHARPSPTSRRANARAKRAAAKPKLKGAKTPKRARSKARRRHKAR